MKLLAKFLMVVICLTVTTLIESKGNHTNIIVVALLSAIYIEID